MFLSYLMLICGAGPDGIAFNRPDFQIPVNIKGDLTQVQSLIIWVSQDEGKSWRPAGKPFPPDQKKFDFVADADGVYYFSISSIDQAGKQHPEDPTQLKVMQRVLVKKQAPKLQINSVDRGEQGITVKWDSKDEFAARETFKLFYQPPTGGAWTEVTGVDLSAGQATFKPDTDVGRVRIEVLDVANNRGEDERLVQAAPAPVPTTPQPFQLTSQPSNTAVRAADSTRLQGWNEPRPNPGLVPARFDGSSPPIATSPSQSQVAGPTVAATTPGSAQEPRVPRGPLTPVKYVNSKRVSVKYTVLKYGVSGIGAVDLYLTRDDGRTWVPYTGERNIQAPMPPDPRNQAPLQHSLTFDLPGEGLYGVYIVVKSGAQIGEQPPVPGQAPQVRFLVDVTPPQVVMMQPVPDKEHHDTILLTWNAIEANPTPTPVLLEWAEQETSEWHVIGPGELPNTGSFAWKVPPGTPARVFLRLTMRDLAGNVAVAQTTEPQGIDLKAPTITGIDVEAVPVSQTP
jgi:hypothetical protein